MGPRQLEHGFRMNGAGVPHYFEGMRIMMFQLSDFYCLYLYFDSLI